MNLKKTNVIPLLFIFLFAGSTFFSCKKDDGPTTAVITVLDTIGRPVKGASITLWQDTSTNPTTGLQSTLRQTKVSDVSGKASFEFKLEAYLNIGVLFNGDTASGEVHVKEHETASATVKFEK